MRSPLHPAVEQVTLQLGVRKRANLFLLRCQTVWSLTRAGSSRCTEGISTPFPMQPLGGSLPTN